MLKQLELKNFKCFGELDMRLSSLNILSGVNGMGKSSIFQSLLILHQSFDAGELQSGRLVLGGEFADLGTGADIMYEDAPDDEIHFKLSDTTMAAPWTAKFEYHRSSDQLTATGDELSLVPPEWESIPPFGGRIVYISAERIGPRKLHDRSETRARRGDIGVHGEFAMNFLNERQQDHLAAADPRTTPDKRKLIEVVDTWLQEITPGAHIGLEAILDADAVIAGFTFDRQGDVESKRYRATNVGFGLSYVLPILLALLAPSGSLVLIENPEAHLHPRGQTKLGEFAARAAAAGLQVIVETHSDHFIDGIRIAVREKIVSPREVCFHYFEREGAKSLVTSPEIDGNGRLSSWPSGFFDQHEENAARLLAPRSVDA